MRTGHILFSAVHFFVVLFIISLGGFFLAFPYAESLRLDVASSIRDNPELFRLIGALVLSIGCLLLVGFYFLNRRRFLKIKMGPAKALVDETIVHDTVLDYWKGLMPENEIEVVVHQGKTLEIIATAPKEWNDETEQHLLKAEGDLGDLLARRLGYKRTFTLTLSDLP